MDPLTVFLTLISSIASGMLIANALIVIAVLIVGAYLGYSGGTADASRTPSTSRHRFPGDHLRHLDDHRMDLIKITHEEDTSDKAYPMLRIRGSVMCGDREFVCKRAIGLIWKDRMVDRSWEEEVKFHEGLVRKSLQSALDTHCDSTQNPLKNDPDRQDG